MLSHGTGADPTFTYGNRAALRIFEMSWRDLLSLPSRLSAEPVDRAARAQLLEQVSKHGCIEDYSGIRIARTGERFLIERATVWNLLDRRRRLRWPSSDVQALAPGRLVENLLPLNRLTRG